jgi:hypothetical protein
MDTTNNESLTQSNLHKIPVKPEYAPIKLHAYKKFGLIEYDKTGPVYLIPSLLKPETITKLRDELSLPLSESKELNRILSYIRNRGIDLGSITEKTTDTLSSNKLWLSLTATVVMIYGTEENKKCYLLSPGSLFIPPMVDFVGADDIGNSSKGNIIGVK